MNTDASHPLSIEADRDVAPGRWLWTVKWLLLVPHVLVLTVLWSMFILLTLIAGVVDPRHRLLPASLVRPERRAYSAGPGASATTAT